MGKKIITVTTILILVLLIGGTFIYFQEFESDKETEDLEEKKALVEDWITTSSPTYNQREGRNLTYSGFERRVEDLAIFYYEFETEYEGYGALEQETTPTERTEEKSIVVILDEEEAEVVWAVTDESYDELEEEKLDEEAARPTGIRRKDIDLYFFQELNEDEIMFETVPVEITFEEENPEEAAIKTLLEGPEENDLVTMINEEAELNSVGVKSIHGDNVAVANFSSELTTKESAKEQIQKTLLQFDHIDDVAILIETIERDWRQEEEIIRETVETDLYFIRENSVEEVEREIKMMNGIEKSALLALLEGPTEEEKEEGFKTLIPEGVEVISYRIGPQADPRWGNEVMTVNFTSEFEERPPVPGTLIHDQLLETLTQFENVSYARFLIERDGMELYNIEDVEEEFHIEEVR